MVIKFETCIIIVSLFRIEVTTQDAITPSFTVTSALRTGSETGSEVSSAMVGDTVYWTIDIPGKLMP